MRIAVSERLCSGQGRCYVMAPEIYVPDDEGYCSQRGTEFEVSPGLEDKAQLGVDACPEGAITVVDG